jgi:hypothetical protein
MSIVSLSEWREMQRRGAIREAQDVKREAHRRERSERLHRLLYGEPWDGGDAA